MELAPIAEALPSFAVEFISTAKVRRKIRNLVIRIADKPTKNEVFLLFALFSEKLRGCLARRLLEHPGEMVGIFEAKLL